MACDLALAVAVERDLAGVLAVLDDHPGGHRVGGAERAGRSGATISSPDAETTTTSRPHSLWSAIRFGGLGEDQRVDDVVQRLVDDRLDLFDVPAGAHIGDVGPHPVHLVVVGARHQEEELGVAGLEHRPPIDQPLIEEGFAESQRAGLRDDRLVEVEERRGANGLPGCRLRLRYGTARGRWVGCGHNAQHRARCAAATDRASKMAVHDTCRRVQFSEATGCFLRQALLAPLARFRVYSEHYSAYAGCASARPPGADTRRPPPPPPWRGSSLFRGTFRCPDKCGESRAKLRNRVFVVGSDHVYPQFAPHPQTRPLALASRRRSRRTVG